MAQKGVLLSPMPRKTAAWMNRPDEISRRTPICSTSADLSATPWTRLLTHP